ncbi:inositol monophosphatase, partial [Cellulomonas sp. KRMCY2]|uniref:inositol monophosphatase family protein n=1 Tax=Cellulomonas sp. KRMCY2 TaxID=1304865 RepID=UPI0004A2DC70
MAREIDVDAVTALITHVADTVVTPRFRDLRDGDVSEKSPGDLVTVVDLAAEAALVEGLTMLGRGIPVVGEEGVAADPRLLDVIAGAEQVWVVDPIDGTQAFVEGLPDHAVMVALVERGRAVGGWICLPQHEQMFVAMRGAGAWCNGDRLARPAPDLTALRGGVATSFLSGSADGLPTGLREQVEPRIAAIGPAAYPSLRLWSGATYARIASGQEDFAFYWRTHPWDHAAGAVLLREVGGVSRRLDGSDYRADDARSGLVGAASAEAADAVIAGLGLG